MHVRKRAAGEISQVVNILPRFETRTHVRGTAVVVACLQFGFSAFLTADATVLSLRRV